MKYRIKYRVRKILETQFQVKLQSIKLECVSRMAFKRFDTKLSKIIECIFDRRENAKREIKIVWTIPAVVIHVVVGSREKYP